MKNSVLTASANDLTQQKNQFNLINVIESSGPEALYRENAESVHDEREAVETSEIADPEDFRDEIERRFRQSEANATYRFPRKKCESSESESEDSIGSLEELTDVLVYDLNSQNLQYYCESPIYLPKKKRNTQSLNKVSSILLVEDSVAEVESRNGNLNRKANLKKFCEEEVIAQAQGNKTPKTMRSMVLNEPKQFPPQKIEFETVDHRGRTPATNDTAYSSYDNRTSSNLKENSTSRRPVVHKLHQPSPSYQIRLLKNHKSPNERKETDTRELSAPQKANLNSNLNAVNCKPEAGKGLTQTYFFPRKGKLEAKDLSKKTNLKRITHNKLQQIVNNARSNKKEDKSCLTESTGRTPQAGLNYGFAERAAMVQNMSDTSMLVPGGMNKKIDLDVSAVYQLKNTSNLYTKTKGDLLRKLKTNQIDSTSLTKVVRKMQERNTPQAFGTPKANSVERQPIGSLRTHNISSMSPRPFSLKKPIEPRIPKLELSKINSSHSKPGTDKPSFNSPRQLYQQTPRPTRRNPSSKLLDKKLESLRSKMDFTLSAQKNGGNSDRQQMESLVALS